MAENQTEVRSKLIRDTFNEFNKNTMPLLDAFYDKDLVFEDPIMSIKGLDALKKYYLGMYENVNNIKFDIHEEVVQGDTHVIYWKMHLAAKRLNGGKPILVLGTSNIKFGGPEGKVVYHRDYFDMGEFIYEQVPVLKSVIGWIKSLLRPS